MFWTALMIWAVLVSNGRSGNMWAVEMRMEAPILGDVGMDFPVKRKRQEVERGKEEEGTDNERNKDWMEW